MWDNDQDRFDFEVMSEERIMADTNTELRMLAEEQVQESIDTLFSDWLQHMLRAFHEERMFNEQGV